ncbi:MBL fold metallo-hydrolase [Streptomyces beihaiensis]|uniref:MBL fold metallo-hydrolase n=1 Tax=Streptomyces beihaiensis TaxID=2984495 RepID=A0ABT3TTT5_9ACTN|nr:MBL fold metallo-hydrolase [Streptomyces beihaiensis]MCX3059941.1 MBL fold metallo-hydrolase [Streptomyces beihaiensis]
MERIDWSGTGWEELAPGVGRVRLPGWDCTSGLVVGEGAALLIDTGSSLREGARLRGDAGRLLAGVGNAAGERARVTHIALTHPHFDHVLGTAAFAGVEVYGPVGIDTLFAARGRDELRSDAVRHGVPPQTAAEAVDVLVTPQHRVSGEWTLDLGGERQVLLANVGPAHSGHDLTVLVPGGGPGGREVVFCGDLVEESGEPQAGPDAAPAHWPAALDRLLALGGEDALYVPGHGSVVNAAFVRAQRATLAERFGVS